MITEENILLAKEINKKVQAGVQKLLLANDQDINLKYKVANQYKYICGENSPLLVEQTLLHTAIEKNLGFSVQTLIEMEADIECTNSFGDTPLLTAVYFERHEIAEMLINKGADINAKNNFGYTPLHLSAINGDKETLKILLEQGAIVNIKDNQGDTALSHALDNDYYDIVYTLVAAGTNTAFLSEEAKMELFICACLDGRFDAAQKMIDAGLDVNKFYNCDFYSLVYYDQYHSPINYSKAGIIHIAVDQDRQDILEFLIKNNAYVDLKDQYGSTPLVFSVVCQNYSIFKFLVENGAELSPVLLDTFTPLQISVAMDDVQMVELAFALGADINGTSLIKGRPIGLAQQLQHTAIFNNLMLKGAMLTQVNVWQDNKPISFVGKFFNKQKNALEKIKQYSEGKIDANKMVKDTNLYDLKFLHHLFKHMKITDDYTVKNGCYYFEDKKYGFTIDKKKFSEVCSHFKKYFIGNYFKLQGICKSLTFEGQDSLGTLPKDIINIISSCLADGFAEKRGTEIDVIGMPGDIEGVN